MHEYWKRNKNCHSEPAKLKPNENRQQSNRTKLDSNQTKTSLFCLIEFSQNVKSPVPDSDTNLDGIGTSPSGIVASFWLRCGTDDMRWSSENLLLLRGNSVFISNKLNKNIGLIRGMRESFQARETWNCCWRHLHRFNESEAETHAANDNIVYKQHIIKSQVVFVHNYGYQNVESQGKALYVLCCIVINTEIMFSGDLTCYQFDIIEVFLRTF